MNQTLTELFSTIECRNDRPVKIYYNTSEVEPYLDCDAKLLGNQVLVYDDDFCQWIQLERLIYTNAVSAVEKGHFVWHNDYRWDFRSQELIVVERQMRRSGGKMARGVSRNSNVTNPFSAMYPPINGYLEAGMLGVYPTEESAREVVAEFEMACLGCDIEEVMRGRAAVEARAQDKRAVWRRNLNASLRQRRMVGATMVETVKYLMDRDAAYDDITHVSDLREYRERLIAELQASFEHEYKTKPNINLDAL